MEQGGKPCILCKENCCTATYYVGFVAGGIGQEEPTIGVVLTLGDAQYGHLTRHVGSEMI